MRQWQFHVAHLWGISSKHVSKGRLIYSEEPLKSTPPSPLLPATVYSCQGLQLLELRWKLDNWVECFQTHGCLVGQQSPTENNGKCACLVLENNHCLKSFYCPQFHWLLCLNSVWLQGMLHVQVMSHKFTDVRQESGQVGLRRDDRMVWTDSRPAGLPIGKIPVFHSLPSCHKASLVSITPEGVCHTAVVLCKHFSGPNGWGYMAFYQSPDPLVESKSS